MLRVLPPFASVLLLGLVSCGAALPAPAPPAARSTPAAASTTSAAPAPTTTGAAGALPTMPLFVGLGVHSRKITTRSADAQRFFDQGMAFYAGFNHAEAIRSFEEAARLDPTCMMAEWGVALANGPHINVPTVPDASARAATEAVARATKLLAGATPVEAQLLQAMSVRYAFPQPADRKPLDVAFVAAMAAAWRAFSTDPDVGALYAEAMMDTHPWAQWTPEGVALTDTPETLATLERVMELEPGHPLANHLYVHAAEGSVTPERAGAAADRLRTMMPLVGHMLHMPSHIDVRRGLWEAAVVANERAVAADKTYLAEAVSPGMYFLYATHDFHMLAYAAMMRGESARALTASRGIVGLFPKAPVGELAAIYDAYLGTELEVLVRFGKWDEVLAAPPRDGQLEYEAMRRYARGVALAARGKVTEAEAEQRAFALARAKVPKAQKFRRAQVDSILAVADRLLAGEILFRAGKREEGLAAMREGVKNEDALGYAEPPSWIHPVRHALGASLLQMKRAPEAEAVYREDLKRNPENGWALMGLGRSLKAQGKAKEADVVLARFAKAWSAADIELSSSCFCQPGE